MEIKNAIITKTELTMSDHGCLTFWLFVEGDGFCVGIGGFCIGFGYLDSKEFKADSGMGLVALMRILDVVGVEKWEDLKGKYIRVMLENWGDPVYCIGNLIKNKWFDLKEFFEQNTRN